MLTAYILHTSVYMPCINFTIKGLSDFKAVNATLEYKICESRGNEQNFISNLESSDYVYTLQ